LNFCKHILLLFLVSLQVNAQKRVMKNFNTKNGLPSNEVYFLYEDKKGFIWVCTDAGIARYNGKSFYVFNSSKGLPDNTVFEVKEDEEDRVWFRTFEGAIGYIKNDSIHTIGASEILGQFTKEGIISSMAINDKGHVYVGRTSIDTCSFIEISPPYGKDNVKEIWKDESGQKGIKIVLVGENDYVFSDSRGNSDLYYIKVFTQQQNLLYKDSVIFDDYPLFTRVSRTSNEMLIISNTNLHKLNLQSGQAIKKQFQNGLVSAFRLTASRIAIGERQKGLAYINNLLNFEDPSVEFNGQVLTHIIQDHQKGYWYSTASTGIYYAPLQSSNYFEILANGTERITKMFSVNDTTILIGTSNGNLIRFHQSSKNTYHWEMIYKDDKQKVGAINSIMQVSKSKYLVSGGLGNIEFDPDKRTASVIWKISTGNIACFKTIAYQNQIIGIGGGHWFIANGTNYQDAGTIYPAPFRFSSMAYDKVNKKIVVGSLKGMYELNLPTNTIDTTKIIRTRIVDLNYTDGMLLISTRSRGLIIKYNKVQDTLDENDGLISNICLSAIKFNDMIWVNTNKGLSKITYYSKDNFYIQNYPLNSFLDPSSFGSLLVMKNKLWFSSDNKLFNFDLYNHETGSRFLLDKMLVNNVSYVLKDQLELKSNENNILFRYSALFYNSNGNIRYRYKINENDSVWKYTTSNEIEFANLSPGNYKFCVEAENSSGKWIKASKQIAFTIEKPFWQTLVFFVMVLIGFGSLVGLGIRWWYLRVLKKQNEANELQLLIYDLETKAIKAQMNPHFIFNSLNTIQQFILSNDNDNAYNYLSKFAKLVRKLLESNTTKSIILEEELDILKRYMEIEALRFEEVFEHNIEIIGNMNVVEKRIPHMLIQPFVENAIWHGLLPKKGHKKLTIRIVKQSEKILICEVEDNGVGRPDKKESNFHLGKSKSLALDYNNERLNLLGKQLNMNLGVEIIDKTENNLKTGTLVRITIPILKN